MVKGLLPLPDTSSLKLSWWTSICIKLAVWSQRDASKPNSLRRGLSCCPRGTGTSIATPPRSAGPTPSCSKVFRCRKFFLSSGTEPRQVLRRQIVNPPGKRRAFLRTRASQLIRGAPMKVVIAEPDAAYRSFVRRTLEREIDLALVAEAADGEQAVRLAQQLKADVVLMDLDLLGVDGLEGRGRITAELPRTKVIVLGALNGESHQIGRASCRERV